jgi:hypothetical protein
MRINKDIQSAKVLLYPSIEFYDDTWLKACLCIWDKVYRIVPSSYSPQDSDEVKVAIENGLIESINLNQHDLEKTAIKFEKFWNKVPFIPAGAEHQGEEYVKLHLEKVDNRIRPMLEAISKKVINDGWLRLTKETAKLYMLFLAETISERRQIPKLTYDDDMFAIMHYFQNKANFDESLYQRDKEETTASIVLPTILPKGLEHIDMTHLLEFRNRNEEGRVEFRKIITEYADGISKVEDKDYARELTKDFSEKLNNNSTKISKNMKLPLDELKYAMVSIGLPTTLTAIGALAINNNDPFDFVNIGASCFIGAVASIADVRRSTRKNWDSTKSSYLVNLKNITGSASGLKFSIPKYDRLLEEFIND